MDTLKVRRNADTFNHAMLGLAKAGKYKEVMEMAQVIP